MSREGIPSTAPPLIEHPFRTMSTSFAAAIVASNQLEFLRAELAANGREVVFVFEDPLAQGDDLHRRFDAGMFSRVEPKVLFSARGFLMDEMARLQGRGRHASTKAL
jgi:hypothetical protein